MNNRDYDDGQMAAEDTSPTLGSTETATQIPFEFTGTGREYFRIWIVNLLFTVLTLGIYSPWAKIRTLKYFYQNTRLEGATFNFHGNPIALLKGRLILAALVILAILPIFYLSPLYGENEQAASLTGLWIFGVVLLGAILLPILIAKSIKYRMAFSSYRGLRFGFSGRVSTAFKVFLLYPIVGGMIGLLAPFAQQRVRRYIFSHAHIGTVPFRFEATAKNYYGKYLKIVGIVLAAYLAFMAVFFLLSLLAGLLMSAMGELEILPSFVSTLDEAILEEGNGDPSGPAILLNGIIFLIIFVPMFSFIPACQAIIENLAWNKTFIGQQRFMSNQTIGDIFKIHFVNMLTNIFTLGLFIPFAKVRLFRYKIQHLAFLTTQSIETLIADEKREAITQADKISSWYDIDISL